MRGNHRIWLIEDFTEPSPMTTEEIAMYQSVDIALKPDMKTVFTVSQDGKVIGEVSTRMAGQLFREPGRIDWRVAAHKWSSNDPRHGKAVVALLNYIKER